MCYDCVHTNVNVGLLLVNPTSEGGAWNRTTGRVVARLLSVVTKSLFKPAISHGADKSVFVHNCSIFVSITITTTTKKLVVDIITDVHRYLSCNVCRRMRIVNAG